MQMTSRHWACSRDHDLPGRIEVVVEVVADNSDSSVVGVGRELEGSPAADNEVVVAG